MKKLFLTSIMVILANSFAYPCTNLLVGKNASADGSTLISYAADSYGLYGELYHWPAKQYRPGELLKVYEWDTGKYLGDIPQAIQTYNVIGNMNEHQLAIGETTFGGRSELTDSTGIMDYGSLIYITLQRAKNAREAITIMTGLVKEHGYYSSGESFSIADPNEVWIMEMIGKGVGNKGAVWVAVRIPDDCVAAHANQARIQQFPLNDPENCLYSSDVISFAREKGYFSGKDADFSFAQAYAPIDFGALRFCEARVWSFFNKVNSEMGQYISYAQGRSTDPMPLYIQPDRKLSAQDIHEMMRDHYEGTELDWRFDVGAGPFHSPYRWSPLTFEVDSVEYCNERPIATQQTGFSFVAQMRSWLPNAIGGILWFGVDDANMSVYLPIYMGMNGIPHELAQGNGNMLEFSWTSAFWVFNWVSNQAYHRYSHMIGDIRKVQSELEDKFAAYGPVIDEAALALHQQDPALASAFLTEYAHNQTRLTVERWKKLGEFLMVKYLDGNLHEEVDGEFLRNAHGNPAPAKFPGYDEYYYRRIVDEAGDRLRMIEVPQN